MEFHTLPKVEHHLHLDRSLSYKVARQINPDLTPEAYRHLEEAFHWNLEHFRTCNLEAISHAFAHEAVKERIRRKLLEAYAYPTG